MCKHRTWYIVLQSVVEGGGGGLLDLMGFIDPTEGPTHAFSTLVLIAGVWCTTIQIRSMKIGQSQLSTFDPNYLASGEHEYYCWKGTVFTLLLKRNNCWMHAQKCVLLEKEFTCSASAIFFGALLLLCSLLWCQTWLGKQAYSAP